MVSVKFIPQALGVPAGCFVPCRQLSGESAESSCEMDGATLGVSNSKLADERVVLNKDQGVFKVI